MGVAQLGFFFCVDVSPLKVLERSVICSAASRCILVPFERYGRPKITPKKVLRHKHPFPNALNIKYFWTLGYNHWCFLGITKLFNP